METFPCPKGHASLEPDYCSECGARLDAVSAAAPAEPPQLVAHCPECGAARDQPGIAFCEICGYNFLTGAAGDSAAVTPPAAPAPRAPARKWQVVMTVDPSLRDPLSPDAPADVPPATLALSAAVSLIGRRSQARAIFPEIDLSHDGAVSHRHALLQVDSAGTATLRDIGAANGTRLNGRQVEPLKDHPLAAGDEITLGHWSRLVLQPAD